jgi:hypothetical protein
LVQRDLEATRKGQYEHDDEDDAYDPARTIAPGTAVAPIGKRSDKNENEDDDK